MPGDFVARHRPRHKTQAIGLAVRFLVLTKTAEGWTVEHHSARYRAITSRALTQAAQDAGFTEVTWISGEDAGFHQPVMTAESLS